jgi:organic radical activating enzyme
MHSYESTGNIKETPIQQVIQGAELKSIRESIAQGVWHPTCRLCRQAEASTGISARTTRHCDPGTLAAIDATPDTYFTLEHIVVNWSNLCNLSCTYCNPATSTAWQQIQGIPINHVKNEHPDLIELAQEHGATVQGLTLGGGEPLLQKGLIDFLQCLNSEQVRVLVTTNLSVDLDRNPVYRELRTWPGVSWQVSFDNADPARFEYVRNGAEWDQFVHNINQMKQDGQQVVAHPAYSIYNALDLDAYYEFCAAHGLDIFWCDLSHPWDLDVRRQPVAVRTQAVTAIDRIVEQYGHTTHMAVTTLEAYRCTLLDNRYLITPEFRPNLVRWHTQKEQELNKTTHFRDIWPEYAN